MTWTTQSRSLSTNTTAAPRRPTRAATSTYSPPPKATHSNDPSRVSTSQPAKSPSNKSSGTSSTNTASNLAAPTGTKSSGATKPTSATPNATPPGPTTHPSTHPKSADVHLPELGQAPPQLPRSSDSGRYPERMERFRSKLRIYFVNGHVRQLTAHECTAHRSTSALPAATPDPTLALPPTTLTTSRRPPRRPKSWPVAARNRSTASPDEPGRPRIAALPCRL